MLSASLNKPFPCEQSGRPGRLHVKTWVDALQSIVYKTLFIATATLADAGNYSCTAISNYGSAVRIAQVRVEGRVKKQQQQNTPTPPKKTTTHTLNPKPPTKHPLPPKNNNNNNNNPPKKNKQQQQKNLKNKHLILFSGMLILSIIVSVCLPICTPTSISLCMSVCTLNSMYVCLSVRHSKKKKKEKQTAMFNTL